MNVDAEVLAVAGGIFAMGTGLIVTFLWRLSDELKKLNAAVSDNNAHRELYEARLLTLESRATVIEAQMIGWDTLKRMELYLSALLPGEVSMAIRGAFRAEHESRRRKDDQ